MTAEICIMNKLGVAMAADSAVTLGNTNKVYNSANKLFALSKTEPVGIMIYGSATFMGIPWETIIKMYRNSNISRCFNSLQEYGEDFINFLKTQRKYISQNDEIIYHLENIEEVFSEISDAISKRLMEETTDKSILADQDIEDLAKHEISKRFEYFMNLKCSNEINSEDYTMLNDMLNEHIYEKAISLFGDLPSTDTDIKEMLIEIGLSYTTKVFTKSKTGIVLSGFGTEEIFPAICAFTIDGFIGNKLKYEMDLSQKVGVDVESAVIPFAQLDMVYSFIEGIDPYVERTINLYLDHLRNQLVGTVEDSLNKIPTLSKADKDAIIKQIITQSENSIDAFHKSLADYKFNEHVDPVLSIVTSLPKDELAEMAGALINLSSLKRRVSSDQETVGGPIDVAIITKGDGLIWIKRKHYFNPEFNSDFFAKNINSRASSIGSGAN
ncbi:TPA: hypothetical protein ACVW7B_003081 [Bacillus cereus]